MAITGFQEFVISPKAARDCGGKQQNEHDDPAHGSPLF
jgi:hypothetical protein